MEQTQQFAAWMMSVVGQIDLAAAWYDKSGEVKKIHPVHLPLRGAVDLARVLPWLRQRNANGFNVWIRPSASMPAHQLVMLDDLPNATAIAVARKYRAAVVETSPGNCQVWIVLSCPLNREQRQNVARALILTIGCGDLGAISEPRWGRLPGFRQRKPGKAKQGWTNLLVLSTGQALDPTPYLSSSASPPQPETTEQTGGACPNTVARLPAADGERTFEREFCFACHRLRAGWTPDRVIEAVADHALARGKRYTTAGARQYAVHTVRKAKAVL